MQTFDIQSAQFEYLTSVRTLNRISWMRIPVRLNPEFTEPGNVALGITELKLEKPERTKFELLLKGLE